MITWIPVLDFYQESSEFRAVEFGLSKLALALTTTGEEEEEEEEW